MKQNDDDTPTAREIKQAISENLQTRYSSDPGLEDFIHKCTALDPRFKTLPHLDPAYQERIYEDYEDYRGLLKDEVYAYMAKECISIDSNMVESSRVCLS